MAWCCSNRQTLSKRVACMCKPFHLCFILQTAFIHLVIPPKVLYLWLTLHRVGAHVEARLWKVDSVLIRTCIQKKLSDSLLGSWAG